jgi:hypothetical protein
MGNRKSFMFYLNWEKQIELLSDEQLRRFVMNLIKYHSDRNDELELKNKEDELLWIGILPALEVNDSKWKKKAEASVKNGSLGGRPSKSIETKPIETHQVISKPNQPDNSKQIIDNSKQEIDNGKLEIDNSEKEKVESKLIIDNSNVLGKPEIAAVENLALDDDKVIAENKVEVPVSNNSKTNQTGGITQYQFFKNKYSDLENKLTGLTILGSSILNFATRTGIEKLKYKLTNEQYQLVFPILVEYINCKTRLEG